MSVSVILSVRYIPVIWQSRGAAFHFLHYDATKPHNKVTIGLAFAVKYGVTHAFEPQNLAANFAAIVSTT